MKVFIFDSNNSWQRAEALGALLKDKATVTPLGSTLQKIVDEDVILYHTGDFEGDLTAKALMGLADRRIVVAYSAGGIERRDVGGVHFRQFSDVERLLRWMQTTWTLIDVRNALDVDWSAAQASGFTALAILAQCASVGVVTGTAVKRQQDWRTNPDQWRGILGSDGLQSLLERAERDGKPIAASLLKWIDTGAEPPDFGAAAKEAAELAG